MYKIQIRMNSIKKETAVDGFITSSVKFRMPNAEGKLWKNPPVLLQNDEREEAHTEWLYFHFYDKNLLFIFWDFFRSSSNSRGMKS
jgi:hypothetical protein